MEGLKNIDWIKLKLCKKRAERIVALKHRLSHTDPTFAKLGILKFDDLYVLNAGIFMHKSFNMKLPISFRGMFKAFPEPNRTRNFVLEETKYKCLDFFPKVSLQKIWNNLSIEMKTTSTVSRFKSMFKREAFEAYKSFRCQDVNCYSCLI